MTTWPNQLTRANPALAGQGSRHSVRNSLDGMVTIDILRWGDPIGTSAWDPYARSELKKRMRRGVRATPDELRRISRLIRAREPLTIPGVSEDAVYGLTLILESTGAEIRILFDVETTPKQPTRSNSP